MLSFECVLILTLYNNTDKVYLKQKYILFLMYYTGYPVNLIKGAWLMISIELDTTLFIQLFFLIIVIIMAKFLYLNPVNKTINARNEKINGLKSTADSQLQSVEDSKKAYEEQLFAVKAEMSAYQVKMQDEASKEVNAIISAAKAEIAKTTDSARAELNKSREEARAALQKEVGDISEMIYKTVSGNIA